MSDSYWTEAHGLKFVRILDGKGGAEAVERVPAPLPEARCVWEHWRLDTEERQQLLDAGFDEDLVEALLTETARPRAATIGGGLLVILRGVNLNPGESPEDMVAVRIWLTKGRVVSAVRRRVMAIGDVLEALDSGDGPVDAGDILVEIAECIAERMRPIIDGLEDDLDDLEQSAIEGESRQNADAGHRLIVLRRSLVMLRRHLAPQRDALLRLLHDRPSPIDEADADKLREVIDRTLRYVEDIESNRERAAVLREELDHYAQARMNRQMYVFSVVAAIFLPLGLLTGLLGINVGGMPGVESPWAFAIVTVLLVVLGIGEYAWMKRLRLI